jgi:hypothetical protein
VGRDENEPAGRTPPAAVTFTDVHGEPTDDAAVAVRGEITEFDPHGRPRRLTRFFMLDADRAPAWLPVSEAAFLLWVLAALIVAWLVVGLVLGLI